MDGIEAVKEGLEAAEAGRSTPAAEVIPRVGGRLSPNGLPRRHHRLDRPDFRGWRTGGDGMRLFIDVFPEVFRLW